ncbi:non-homologous end-joining factor 1 [Copidosoma floridanum]|uniref:non-homologous end-joining factor 1 n=1 Tax=Copidosoma floridanum TaxID=29053 RepID=UPI0006C999C1|nr:non-homologous end-joining factor 1 [Copidosoma floridanum]
MSESEGKHIAKDNYKYKELLIDEQKYLVGVRKRNGSWQILVTNLVEAYEETLTEKTAVARCKQLNPFLVDIDFNERLNNLLIDIPKYAIVCTVQCLKLAFEIEGGKFMFEIKLAQCNPEYFHDNIMNSLYCSFSELHHRYQNLLDIVKKKDKEIEEYKAQGVEILRHSLVTEPFTEKVFNSKLKNSESTDKINVFLNALNLYESLESTKSNDISGKQRSIGAESKSQLDETKPKVKCEGSVKRPWSKEMRCAVNRKLPKRVKDSKQNSAFQYL